MNSKPNPELAEWIERGLSIPNVIEEKTLPYPIDGYACEDKYADDDEQWKLGRTVPLHHVRVNVIGAAFIGKVGNLEEAWRLWLGYKRSCGIEGWVESSGVGTTFDFLGITYQEALFILSRHLGWGCNVTSCAEIARLLRSGGL